MTVTYPEVEVRRSAKRRRTVSARREAGRTIIRIPAVFSEIEERCWVSEMVARLDASASSRGAWKSGDPELNRRAAELSARFLDCRVPAVTVAWAANLNNRWVAVASSRRAIRLSSRLRSVPGYVTDFLLLQELDRLSSRADDLAAAAGPLSNRHPDAEKARAFLDGFAAGIATFPAGPARPQAPSVTLVPTAKTEQPTRPALW